MLKNPKVIGVKNSSMPIQDIQMFKRQAAINNKEVVVFNGPDEQFVGGRLIGADGGIGGTYGVMPELFVKLNALLEAGDFENAGKLQNDIDEVIYTMCSTKGNMYATAKAALKKLAGLDLGGVRAPLLNLEDGDEAIVDKVVSLVETSTKKWIK
jgi:N-acetylneuraminate lyase